MVFIYLQPMVSKQHNWKHNLRTVRETCKSTHKHCYKVMLIAKMNLEGQGTMSEFQELTNKGLWGGVVQKKNTRN